MVSLEIIALVLTGLGLTASIFYYANILNNANKARERELIYQRISSVSPDFYRDWNKVFLAEWSNLPEWLKHRKENPEDSPIYNYILVTFNSLGAMLKKKILDPELIFSVYGPHYLIWTWEKVRPLMIESRKMMNYSELMDGFEHLYDVARKEYPDLTGLDDFRQMRTDLLNKHLN
jgi:hypothetical protein